MSIDYLQGGANILGSILNYKSQLETNKANQLEAQKARDFNVSMWQRQNEYNTPQMQMQRLQAAGLNPNLIYGNGSASTGNASNYPQTSPVNYRAPQLDVPNIVMMLSQLSQIEKTKAETANEGIRAGILAGQKKAIDIENRWKAAGFTEDTLRKYQTNYEMYKNTLIDNQRLLKGLRGQEYEMNSFLKPYGIDARAPFWIKMLFSAANRTDGKIDWKSMNDQQKLSTANPVAGGISQLMKYLNLIF